MAPADDSPEALPYKIKKRETVAEASGLSVRIFTLAPGETLPWHYHSAIDDIFFCLEGIVAVETRAPAAQHLLKPGERLSVPARQPHLVTNAGPGVSRYLLVQGVGEYDFVRAD